MKKNISTLLAITMFFMCFSFVGCQKKPAFPDKTGIPESERTPTPVGLSYNVFIWWEQTEKEQSVLNDAWYDFRELYAGTKYAANINMFTMEADVNGTTQLEQQVMAGTAPDLVKMDHVYITALGQKGLLYDLQDKWQATDKIGDRFITSTWEACSSGDAVYGIPFDANTMIFGAKTPVLEQAGVSIPTTYEDLQMAGAKINALNTEVKPYYLPFEDFDWSPIVSYYMTWLWRLGGELLNEDDTKAAFNDTETGVKALEMMLQLKKESILAVDRYAYGETAMGDYGTWWMNGVPADMEFSLQPELKEGIPGYSVLGLFALGIVTTARLPEEAYDFAVHLATEQHSVTKQHYVYTYCVNNSVIPALKKAAETENGEFWKVSTQQLELSKYRPPVLCWPEIEEALTTEILLAYLGEKTPKQALDDAAEVVNRLLEEWHK